MVKDERTCTQLQEILEVGIKTTLERRFIRYLETKTSIAETKNTNNSNSNPPSYSTRGRGKGRGRGRGKATGGKGAKGKNKSPLQPKITDYAIMLQNLTTKPSNLSFQSRFNFQRKEITPDDLLPATGLSTIKTPSVTVDISGLSNLNTEVAQKQKEKEAQKLPEGLEEFDEVGFSFSR